MPDAPAPHPLRRWRARNRWPLTRLAKALGTTPATCSRIECGRQFPRPELLIKLVSMTGISAERFLARRPKPAP